MIPSKDHFHWLILECGSREGPSLHRSSEFWNWQPSSAPVYVQVLSVKASLPLPRIPSEIGGLYCALMFSSFPICCYCLVAQSCPALCDPVDCSPPGSSVHGILQARILESVAVSSSRGSSWPRDRTWVSCIAGGFFTSAGMPFPPHYWVIHKASRKTGTQQGDMSATDRGHVNNEVCTFCPGFSMTKLKSNETSTPWNLKRLLEHPLLHLSYFQRSQRKNWASSWWLRS